MMGLIPFIIIGFILDVILYIAFDQILRTVQDTYPNVKVWLDNEWDNSPHASTHHW